MQGIFHRQAIGLLFEGQFLRNSTQDDDIADFAVTHLVSHIISRQTDILDIVSALFEIAHRRVINQVATRLEILFKAVVRRQVHRDHHIRMKDERRTDFLIRDNYGTVGGSAAHFRTIGREPGNVFALFHSGKSNHLSDDHNTLAAKTGNDDIIFHFFASSSGERYTPKG